MSIVVAFDPGKTTGVIIVKALGLQPVDELTTKRTWWAFNILRGSQIPWEDRFTVRDWLVSAQGFAAELGIPLWVVYESFSLYASKAKQQINSEFPSVEVIGLINAYAHEMGLDDHIVKQKASLRKSSSVLPQHRKILANQPHMHDAYQHARYFVVNMGTKLVVTGGNNGEDSNYQG